MNKRYKLRLYILWLVGLWSLVFCSFVAYAAEPIRIGVLAYRAKSQSMEQWKPLVVALKQSMPENSFSIEVYTASELETAVPAHQVDFVLTNPSHYIKLSRQNALSAPLATLITLEKGLALSVLGGVIFTRADRTDIQSLADLKGKRIATVGKESLGGYLAQVHEMQKAGIHLPEQHHLIKTGLPHDQVIDAVVSGRADAGFTRTGIIESLIREGKLDAHQIKIINRQNLTGFPVAASTQLYPEWPFAAMSHVDENTSRRVAAALFTLEDNSDFAEKMGIHGFGVPADYTPVVELLRELRAPPFDTPPKFTLRDVLQRYQWQFSALLVGFILIVLLSFYLISTRRKLRLEHKNMLLHQGLLRESQVNMQAIFNAMPDLLFDLGLDGKYYAVHSPRDDLLASSEDELLGKTVQQVLPPDAAEVVMSSLQEAYEHGFSQGKQFQMHLPKGKHWFELSVSKKASLGQQPRFIVLSRDITDRKDAEADTRIAATAFDSQVSLLVTDANRVILRANSAFCRVTGYLPEEVIGRQSSMFRSGRQDDAFYVAMWEHINREGIWQGEIWNKRKNGEIYPGYLSISAIKNERGEVTNYVSTLNDITERKAAAEEIENLAFYDPLTSLPNRRLLIDRLNQAIAVSKRSGKGGALLFLDLDHFKTLNDTLGHDLGDILLQEVSKRLTKCVREGDTVARLGGDEFVVMLEDLSAHSIEAAMQVEHIGHKILDALNRPYQLDTHEYHSTPSIGIALFSDHGETQEELLKHADIAMYQAKKAGRNTLRFFDPDMQETINSRAALEAELRKALERKQFELYYQMQVDNEGYPLGAEVLIRWVHPARGLVSPFHFIPLAEETGLILPIGEWVLNTACAQISRWQQHSHTQHLTLSVNVSAKQFRQPDFVSQVKRAVERHGINPMLLKLELTESMLLDQIELTIDTMNALKDIGVRFSLDDFGTGYSSLQYLKKLPLYQLKIDQSFVRDIAEDISDQAIVRTIIAMAQTLNLNVIAEGVETEQQRKLLHLNGCNTYQGYLFAKPVPIGEFEESLQQGMDNAAPRGVGENI